MVSRRGFQEKDPWGQFFGQNDKSYPSRPPSSVTVVRAGAASDFVAVEISLRNILSSFPGLGPQSGLPTPQCINALCYFLLEQIKSGTMTHAG